MNTMPPRPVLGEEHDAFRDTVRRFVEREVRPCYLTWEEEGRVPKTVWQSAGAAGLLCPDMPEEFGGAGGDFICNAIVHEELARIGAGSFSACLIAHSDIVSSYFMELGTTEQKRRWLPAMARGDAIAAIGMTEPNAGSDLKALKTLARPRAGGYVLHGQKTFITNGSNADVVIVAAKTQADGGKNAVNLFIVDSTLPGFRRGRLLEKVGQHAGDTAELFFDGIELADDALLGALGSGFASMMRLMPRERIAIAMTALAEAEHALQWTIEHVRQRVAFGQPLARLQTIRFKIAEVATELNVARVFVDSCLERQARNNLDLRSAVMAKYWVSEVAFKALDDCLQLFGGYGYMREYPISRAWVDSRIHRIYGGSNEIMKDIIGRDLLG